MVFSGFDQEWAAPAFQSQAHTAEGMYIGRVYRVLEGCSQSYLAPSCLWQLTHELWSFGEFWHDAEVYH